MNAGGALLSDWRVLAAFIILSWGGYSIVLKLIANKLPWQASMLLFVVGYALVAGFYCLLNFSTVNGSVFKPVSLLALGAGVLCGLGAIAFFKALPLAPGSVFIPLVGLSVLVAAIGCLIILKEPISCRSASGIVLAVVSIILLGK